MPEEILKLNLTKAALERLFQGEPEIEIHLRTQACREIVERRFSELANEELWKLSHKMTEAIAAEVAKVVEGYELGERDPTGRWKWYLSYPTAERIDYMIMNACKKYFTERVEAMAAKAVEGMTVGSETFEELVARTVKRLVATKIQTAVTAEVTASIDKVVQAAIAERSIKLKVVQE